MARLAANPEIYRRSICICRIRGQVNQVSGELIQVSRIESTSWALAKRKFTSTRQPASFFSPFLFLSVTPHPVCLPH